MNVVCEDCGCSYTAHGLKNHQYKCDMNQTERNKKDVEGRKLSFESEDVNAFANILSFLSNQSIVKLQAATGAHYNGSNTVASSICCPCENDELVIVNGLCLACNKVKDPTFRENIPTAEAKWLYGLQHKDAVPHKRGCVDGKGYFNLFKYTDLESYAVSKFGSKQAWLEQLALKTLRQQKVLRAKQKAEEDYRALLSTFSSGFRRFVHLFAEGYFEERWLRDRAERYDLVSVELELLGRRIDDHLIGVMWFVLDDTGSAEHVAHSIDRNIKEKEQRKRMESRKFFKSLPKEFVSYLGDGAHRLEKSELESRYARYRQLFAALRNRRLRLRSDSVLCRNYVKYGQGVVDDIVDMVEEMRFLLVHTSYARNCSDIRSFYNEDADLIPASELRESRERIKHRIRDSYLRDARGLELPRMWQRLARP